MNRKIACYVCHSQTAMTEIARNKACREKEIEIERETERHIKSKTDRLRDREVK